MEEQEIDVRGRRQLAASVTSQGHDRALRELLACARGRVFRGRAADAQEQCVHHVAARGRDLEAVQPEPLAHAEALAFQAQEAAVALLRESGAVLAGGIDRLRCHVSARSSNTRTVGARSAASLRITWIDGGLTRGSCGDGEKAHRHLCLIRGASPIVWWECRKPAAARKRFQARA
jgi:hypothetical protein